MRARTHYLHTALLLLLVPLLVLSATPHASAALSGRGPIKQTGPGQGYPLWYQDKEGTALELNLGPVNSFFDPVIVGNPVSEAVGFGAEAFYWDAGASIDIPTFDPPKGGSADLILALEAAWLNEEPIIGDEAVFQRIRIRIDTPVAGTYRVIHPLGERTFYNVPADRRGINFTEDGAVIGFDLALARPLGPFLTSTTAPPGFLGDAATATTVTGSPTGNNIFRVEGPPGSNLDGLGNDFVETDLFTVQGKIYQGTPFVPKRATYSRGATGAQADVWAVSDTATSLDVSGFSANPLPMIPNSPAPAPGRRFWASFPIPSADEPSSTVTVTGGRGTPNESSLTVPLEDIVTVNRAEYNSATRLLSIEASSSDQVGPRVLTVTEHLPVTDGTIVAPVAQYGPMTDGILAVPDLATPPAEIEVTSDRGGRDVIAVQVIRSDRPIAADDSARVLLPGQTQVEIDVLANDAAYGGFALEPSSVTTSTSPAHGTLQIAPDGKITYTPVVGFKGTDSFLYTVANNKPSGDPDRVSNEALVTIQVLEDLIAPITTAQLLGPGGTPINGAVVNQPVNVVLGAVDPIAAAQGAFALRAMPLLSAAAIAADPVVIRYTLDGQAETVYGAPFSVGDEGKHTITYYSTDLSGNKEDPQTITFTIDKTKPTVSVTSPVLSSPDTWHGSATISATGNDGQSGSGSNVRYRIDGGAGMPLTAPIVITADGVHTVQVWAVDGAGNASAIQTVTVKIDKTAPAMSHSFSRKTGEGSFTINAVDDVSGVATRAYHVDGGKAAIYTSPLKIKAGKHKVTFWSFDTAGNKSVPKSVVVEVKTTPKLSLPKASPAAPKRMKTFTMSGKVGSADLGKTRMSFVIQRRVDGKWKAYKTVRTTLITGRKTFSAKTKLAKTGTFRVRTTHAADAMHVSGVSKWKTFKVE